jgi:hypothetical protein
MLEDSEPSSNKNTIVLQTRVELIKVTYHIGTNRIKKTKIRSIAFQIFQNETKLFQNQFIYE